MVYLDKYKCGWTVKTSRLCSLNVREGGKGKCICIGGVGLKRQCREVRRKMLSVSRKREKVSECMRVERQRDRDSSFTKVREEKARDNKCVSVGSQNDGQPFCLESVKRKPIRSIT